MSYLGAATVSPAHFANSGGYNNADATNTTTPEAISLHIRGSTASCSSSPAASTGSPSPRAHTSRGAPPGPGGGGGGTAPTNPSSGASSSPLGSSYEVTPLQRSGTFSPTASALYHPTHRSAAAAAASAMNGLYGGGGCGGGSSDGGGCYPGVVGGGMAAAGATMPSGMGAAAAAAAGLYSGCPPGVGMGAWTNPGGCGGVIPPAPVGPHPHTHPYSHHPYDHPAVGSLAAAYATTPYGTAADRYSSTMDAAARRKNATRETTNTLKAWLYEHRKNPYPTKGEKIMLAIITKMTLTQVSTWFANARRRLKKENKMTWEPRNRPADNGDDEDKTRTNEDDEDDDDDDLTEADGTSSSGGRRGSGPGGRDSAAGTGSALTGASGTVRTVSGATTGSTASASPAAAGSVAPSDDKSQIKQHQHHHSQHTNSSTGSTTSSSNNNNNSLLSHHHHHHHNNNNSNNHNNNTPTGTPGTNHHPPHQLHPHHDSLRAGYNPASNDPGGRFMSPGSLLGGTPESIGKYHLATAGKYGGCLDTKMPLAHDADGGSLGGSPFGPMPPGLSPGSVAHLGGGFGSNPAALTQTMSMLASSAIPPTEHTSLSKPKIWSLAHTAAHPHPDLLDYAARYYGAEGGYFGGPADAFMSPVAKYQGGVTEVPPRYHSPSQHGQWSPVGSGQALNLAAMEDRKSPYATDQQAYNTVPTPAATTPRP